MEANEHDVVFADSQIGKGLRPLAQHGAAVVGADGMFTLIGTKGDVIDRAPISEVSAKRVLITGGQTVSIKIQDRKYNLTPGWGASLTKWAGVLGTASAAKSLVRLIDAGGQLPGQDGTSA